MRWSIDCGKRGLVLLCDELWDFECSRRMVYEGFWVYMANRMPPGEFPSVWLAGGDNSVSTIGQDCVRVHAKSPNRQ